MTLSTKTSKIIEISALIISIIALCLSIVNLTTAKKPEVDEVKDAEYIEEEKMMNDMLEKYDE